MRAHIKLVFVIIFIFLVIGILIYLITDSFNSKVIGFDDLIGNEKQGGEGFADGEIIDSPRLPSGRAIGGGGGTGGGAGGGAGGEGGGGAGGSASSVGNCFGQQIAYSLKNFIENSVCDEFQGSFCVKKIMNCSLEVYNLDDNTSGIFGVRFSFLEEESAFDYLSKEFNVGAGEHKIFEGVLEIESLGESGRANKDLSCSFNTYKVPKEEICG